MGLRTHFKFETSFVRLLLQMEEKISFIGAQTPKEVAYLSKNIKSIAVEDFEKLVKSHVATIGKETSHEEFSKLMDNVEMDLVQKFYPGISLIIRKSLRQSDKNLSKQKFVSDLKDLGIVGDYRDVLVKALFGVERTWLREQRPTSYFPTMQDLRWRVDVAISTTTLNRSLEPSVLFDLKTSAGENHTFEVSKEKFHVLRYAVAEALNNIQQLQKRSVFKMDI